MKKLLSILLVAVFLSLPGNAFAKKGGFGIDLSLLKTIGDTDVDQKKGKGINEIIAMNLEELLKKDEEIKDNAVKKDNDGDGFSENEGDCNDRDPSIYPGATDLNDSKDNDCDGEIDEDVPPAPETPPTPTEPPAQEEPPTGEESPPDLSDIIGDDITNDPDPPAETPPTPQREEDLRTDDDGDGFSENEGDCNDRDPSIYPGATDLNDSKDNDCDGELDEDVPTQPDDIGNDDIQDYLNQIKGGDRASFNKIERMVISRLMKKFRNNIKNAELTRKLDYSDLLNQSLSDGCEIDIFGTSQNYFQTLNSQHLQFRFSWYSKHSGIYSIAITSNSQPDEVIAVGNYNPDITEKVFTYIDFTNSFTSYQSSASNVYAKWNEYVKSHGIKVTLRNEHCSQNQLWKLQPHYKQSNILAQPPAHAITDPIYITLIGPSEDIFYKIGSRTAFQLYTKAFIINPGQTLFTYSIGADGQQSVTKEQYYGKLLKKKTGSLRRIKDRFTGSFSEDIFELTDLIISSITGWTK